MGSTSLKGTLMTPIIGCPEFLSKTPMSTVADFRPLEWMPDLYFSSSCPFMYWLVESVKQKHRRFKKYTQRFFQWQKYSVQLNSVHWNVHDPVNPRHLYFLLFLSFLSENPGVADRTSIYHPFLTASWGCAGWVAFSNNPTAVKWYLVELKSLLGHFRGLLWVRLPRVWSYIFMLGILTTATRNFTFITSQSNYFSNHH